LSTNYVTYQQHEPLRIPSNWGGQEKKFIHQLEETFDDIYKRFGRLRLEDMSKTFRKSWKDMNDELELKIDASTVEAVFKSIGADGYQATGIINAGVNGITVRHSSMNCHTEMSAAGFKILDSSNNLMGGITTLNNKVVTAMSNMYNPSFPLLNLDIGAWNSAPHQGQMAQGLVFHFDTSIPAAIGLFKESGENYYTYEMECDGYMDLYSTKFMSIKSRDSNLQIESENGNVIIKAITGDVIFRMKWYDQIVDLSARAVYDYLYGY